MKRSLVEELLELKPTTDFDIEDERPIDSDEEPSVSDGEVTNHYVPVGKSKLRQSIPNAYGGTKVSRKDLYDQSSDDAVGDSDEDQSVDDDEELSLVDHDEESDSGISLDGEASDTDVSSDGETNVLQHDDSDDDESRNKLKQLMTKERQTIGQRIAQSTINDSLKGYSIIKQNKLFDQLIETRIKLQKSLTNANQLPFHYMKEFEPSEEIIDEIEHKCFTILDNIIKLRNKINHLDINPKKKRKLSNYADVTHKLDANLNNQRSTILNKWSNKINNSSGSNALNASKFKVINQSAEQQVQNNLNDLTRLKKRTYLNRSSIIPLGYNVEQPDDDNNDDDNEPPQDNPEKLAKNEIKQIFNDEDFYRILLNDLVDKKISNPMTNITLLKTNQKALKNNKNIDTKASKGRKLKFNVQEPIAHFDTPANLKWDDDQIDEFFASLLGQKINMNEDEEIDVDDNEEEIVDDGIKLFS